MAIFDTKKKKRNVTFAREERRLRSTISNSKQQCRRIGDAAASESGKWLFCSGRKMDDCK
jgi:hypothetical protein